MKKREFEMEKELIKLEEKARLKCEKVKHKNRMAEIEEEEEAKIRVEKIRDANARQLLRIKSAEIKRTQDRRRENIYAKKHAEQINKDTTSYQQ